MPQNRNILQTVANFYYKKKYIENAHDVTDMNLLKAVIEKFNSQ